MQKNYLSGLNAAQFRAAQQIYGPVLVLAGPGTGKTHMLTRRIAHILSAGVGANPENILCLTFTENAAVEMRERLQHLIGPTAYRIQISTFHGFSQFVMDQYPEVFSALIGPREVADDLQKALIYREAIRSKRWQYFSNVWDEFVFQQDFLGAVSNLKREQIDPEGFRALIPAEKDRLEQDPSNYYQRKFKSFQAGDFKPQARKKIDNKIAKMYELAELWSYYESLMQQHGVFDFDDLINFVNQTLENNDMIRLDLQERFQWILVDEYQDTNDSQNAILWHLCDEIEDPNIFAVGDDDQSIYRFQGASVANVAAFRSRCQNRIEVSLTENYRSESYILEAAYNVVSLNEKRALADRKLTAVRPNSENAAILHHEFESQYGEVNFLAETINHHIENGFPPEEIAILVRKNKEIEWLAKELPKFGLKVSARVTQDVFNEPAVRSIIDFMCLCVDLKDDARLLQLMYAPFLKVDNAILLQLSLALSNKTSSSIVAMLLHQFDAPKDSLETENLFSALEAPSSDFMFLKDEKIKHCYTFISDLNRCYRHLRPAVIAEKILYESGLAKYLNETDNWVGWQSVRKFIDWLGQTGDTEIQVVLDKIELHQTLEIALRPDPLPADSKSVQIMTAHKAKGLEFGIVFIPGVTDRKWGNNRVFGGIPLPQIKLNDVQLNDEERRLFFVALTRAKSKIYTSHVTTDFNGRAQSPSQFIGEIGEDLVDIKQGDDDIYKLLPTFLSSENVHLTLQEKTILESRVKSFIWSASSLQSYLDCPRQFLYQYLYRFPRKPLPHLAVGVALHEALEKWFKSEDKTELNLLSLYEYALTGQNLTNEKFREFKDHGSKVLKKYFHEKLLHFAAEHPYGFELEYAFSPHLPAIDGVRINGKVDKVVYLDEDQKQARIVDYKSGKPKTIKSGDRLWRQLVFYDLMARNSQGLKWNVTELEIDFLTADHQGNLVQKIFEITDEDRMQVITELKSAHQSLLNLEFPLVPNPNQDPEIDYWQHLGA